MPVLPSPSAGSPAAARSCRGLFALEKNGVSLAPVVEAARSLLATLTAEQRQAACFAIGDEAWRMWSNIHPWLMRHGVCLAELVGDQRAAALGLLRESDSGHRQIIRPTVGRNRGRG